MHNKFNLSNRFSNFVNGLFFVDLDNLFLGVIYGYKLLPFPLQILIIVYMSRIHRYEWWVLGVSFYSSTPSTPNFRTSWRNLLASYKKAIYSRIMYFELYFSIHKCYKFNISTCAVCQFTNPITKPRDNLNLKTTYMYFTINREKTQEIEGGEELDDIGNK